MALRSTHNYTDCCVQNNVSPQCLGFCAIHNIIEGKTGIEPEACETYFPFIVKCMAGEWWISVFFVINFRFNIVFLLVC